MGRIKRFAGMLLFLLILAGSFGLAAIFNTTMIWAVWYAFVFIFLLCLGQLIWPLTSVAWRLRPVERPADTPFSLTGTVANRRWWQWQPQWQAQDHTGWLAPVTLLGKRPAAISVQAQFSRGIYTSLRVPVRSQDLFGLLSKGRRVVVPADVTVYPAVPAALVRQLLPMLSALRAGQRAGLVDPYSLQGYRQYIPGDPLGVVDWRVSARVGHTMIRELTPEPTPFVHVVFNANAQTFNEQEWALFFGLQRATRNWTNVWYWWPTQAGTWAHAHELPTRIAAAYQAPATVAAWSPGETPMRDATIVALGTPLPAGGQGIQVVQAAVGPDGRLTGNMLQRKEQRSS